MKSPKAMVNGFESAFHSIWQFSERLDEIRINQGLMLAALNETRNSTNLADYDFKVFS
jgi:hypothetical protein